SGVVTDQTSGYFKVNTPLSDFGLILPISQPAVLISTVKAGMPHWDGILDFSLKSKLEQIIQLAVENKFEEAKTVTQNMIKTSHDPILLYAGGMLNFCTGDLDKAKYFFKKLALIEHENTTARLMLYIIDWISNQEMTTPLSKPLFSMAWHEENEFLGYLAIVLRDKKTLTPGFIEFENNSEKSWRMFIEGLILEKNNKLGQAQAMFKTSILNANPNDWIYFLSFSRLNHIQAGLSTYLEDKKNHKQKTALFQKKAREYRKNAAEHQTAMTTLIQQFESDKPSYDEKVDIYKVLLDMAPENRTIIGRIAFFHATQGEWQKTIDFIDTYFEKPGRETSLSLSLGLLKGEVLKLMGKQKEAVAYLNQFSKRTRNTWYSLISKHLISKAKDDDLLKLAGRKAEKLITMHTALGLWAEGNKNQIKAANHYREALSTYLDDWNEYDLALKRIIHFRQALK
ncbi:MAG: hypothetical protein L3J69_18370, partial [Desulfobacula sp.]|nr:hypothetical protein [Desulfobacula sp.]